MILIDTSVWVDYLRRGNDRVVDLLKQEAVLCHPFVIGELACGHMRQRGQILGLLQALPQALLVTHNEVLEFVDRPTLIGKGLGWIDVHLLASTIQSGARLWTADGNLAKAARAHAVEALLQ